VTIQQAALTQQKKYGPRCVPLWSDSCGLRLKGHWSTVTYSNIVAFSKGPALMASSLRDSSRAQRPNEENIR
jgi:hypothetical protein